MAIMLAATPAFAQGGDGGEIARQFLGTALSPCTPPCVLTPPDMGGSVGPNQVVQMLNGSFTVYSRTGSVLDRTTDSSFWLSAGAPSVIVGTGLSDPRIIYDPASQRWFASEISIGNGTNANQILVAVSKNANPLSGFSSVFFNSSSGTFGDFPTLGVNKNSVVIGTNNFPNIQGEEGLAGASSVSIFSLPKTDLLAATPTAANISRFDSLPFSRGWTPQPATNFDGIGAAPVLGVISASNPTIITSSPITGGGGAGATLGPVTNATMNFGGQPQAGRQPSGVSIDPGDNRISSGPFQVGHHTYFAQSIQREGSDAIQWGILNDGGKLTAQGLITMPNLDLLYPSISANADGTFVVGFNGSGPANTISGYFDVCRTTSAGIRCATPQLDFAGLVGNYALTDDSGVVRWGDYSWVAADPLNPDDFWLFQEYPINPNTWGTVISEISTDLPEPASLLLLGAGFGGLAILRRRRVRSTA